MECRGLARQKLRAQIVEKLIGDFERVASPCEKSRFVTAGLAYEKITRQFLPSDLSIRLSAVSNPVNPNNFCRVGNLIDDPIVAHTNSPVVFCTC